MDVRLLIASWPAESPRGAVTRFCSEHDISRSRFYELRRRALEEGLPAVLADRSRAPRRNPRAVPLEVEDLAVRIREQLADDGWDCGPLSVAHELRRLGVVAPSRATLARIFTRRGLVEPSPRKRPRSSWRRFTFPAPNSCWQLDATEWALLDGTTVVVFQVLDDHSRRVLASLVAPGETSDAACQVVQTALDGFGVPELFLTDNGVALNPGRRGVTGQLPALLLARGCKPISSRPHHPQTCGKNERVHATLKRYLRARPRAASIGELQAHVDAFDEHYNQHRPHQALHGRTPTQAWNATPCAPPPAPPVMTPPATPASHSATRLTVTQPKVAANGNCWVAHNAIQLGYEHNNSTVIAVRDNDCIDIFDANGTHLRTITLEPGRHFYGSGRPRGGNLTMRRSAGNTPHPPSATS